MLKQASTLPEKIRFIRQELQLSRLELSKLVNVSESSVQHYESGLRSPSDRVIQRLVTITGLSRAMLVDDSNVVRKLNTVLLNNKVKVLEHLNNEQYVRGKLGAVKDILIGVIVVNEIILIWERLTEDDKSDIIVSFLSGTFE